MADIYLSDGPLCIARGALLLDPVEDEIVPGVGVQLPGLLLQILHHPPDVEQFPEELLLEQPLLLTVKVMQARLGVQRSGVGKHNQGNKTK